MQLAELNPVALVAAAIISICIAGLVVLLLATPRQNCFFLRWHPETMFLALMAAPFLLILWPLVLVFWLMRSGVIPRDPDFYDD
jgi:archaellum biogenesis protein FlaJ (TadC family)